MSNDGHVKVAVMGATGTGKSTFIRHLTNDTKIHIGHNPESETSEVQTACYTDRKTDRPVMLIDTPGFDDSREGITDTDILQKIIDFLQPENGEGKKLNGIIYMHRISDPRVGGLAKKNLRMFQALCGEKSLRNVRIVTTNWDRVIGDEGPEREEQLKQGAFQPLLASGAQMVRHSNNAPSAQLIMAALVPLKPVSTQLQDDVANGKALGDTDAGRIINKDIEDLKKKHAEELATVKSKMEEAARVRDAALRAELNAKRKVLEEKVMRAEADNMQLGMTIGTLRHERKTAQEELKHWKTLFNQESTKLQLARAQAENDTWKLRYQLEHAERQRLQDLVDKLQRRDAKNVLMKEREEKEARRRQGETEQLVAEAEHKAAMLQRNIATIEAQKRKAEEYANRGVFSRFLHDMSSVANDWAEEGESNAGPLGGLFAGMVGLGVSPFVALKRAVVGK